MHCASHRSRLSRFAFVGWLLCLSGGITQAEDTRQASALGRNDLWRRTLDLVSQGEFEKATETIRLIEPADESIIKARPSACKGTYLKSCTLSSTMGPGPRMDPVGLTAHFSSKSD